MRRTIDEYKDAADQVYYDPYAGVLIWRNGGRWGQLSGCEAGKYEPERYLHVTINKKSFASHKMAFFIMTGQVPDYIDHIDCDKSNNVWNNLRECTQSANLSRRLFSNSTGLRGVGFDRSRNKFSARISISNKTVHLGRFETAKQAARAYDKKAVELHGEMAVLNFGGV